MDYYKDQLKRIEVGKTEYAPNIKINANGNGENTNHLDLNDESASVLVEWLVNNFNINAATKENLTYKFFTNAKF